jgi:hypothetical protein
MDKINFFSLKINVKYKYFLWLWGDNKTKNFQDKFGYLSRKQNFKMIFPVVSELKLEFKVHNNFFPYES